MNFLGELGIDLKLLIAQIVNFLLLLIALYFLVYKPVIKKIEKDENELLSLKKKTDEIKEKNKKEIKQNNISVNEARKKAMEIIQEADQIAQKIKEKARKETAQEKKAVIQKIKSQLKGDNEKS